MVEIYTTNANEKARYVLGRYVQDPLIVLGVNPSKATLQAYDPTIRKVAKFAEILGHDGFIMLNLYPQRATDPKDIHRKYHAPWFKQNMLEIEKILKRVKKPKMWAAWGDLIETRTYFSISLARIVHLSQAYRPNWIHLHSLTQKGHPRHPARMAYHVTEFPFDINSYLAEL